MAGSATRAGAAPSAPASAPPAPLEPGTAPPVTVVVLNWCGESDTDACLRSLLASDYPALSLLLVDNGSPDGSGERLHARFPEVPYLQTGANLGFTGGNNRGIAHALAQGADYVLVLNNDTEVEPDAVTRLVEAAEREPAAGAVGAKILYHDAPDLLWFAGGTLSRRRGVGYHVRQDQPDVAAEGEPVEEVTFLTGCCMLLPRAVLERVGGFEEDFFAYVEDVDLSLRLLDGGYRLLYQPAARIYHRTPRGDVDPTPWQIVQAVRNRRRMARRRLRPAERIQFHAFFYLSRGVHILRYLSRGDRARARAVWEGLTTP